MEQCPWCQGTLDPNTHHCQQCGRLPEASPIPEPESRQGSTYLQLGLGRGASYLDFDLEIGQGQQGIYPLLVLRAPAGGVSVQLRFPFDKQTPKQELLEWQNGLWGLTAPCTSVLGSH